MRVVKWFLITMNLQAAKQRVTQVVDQMSMKAKAQAAAFAAVGSFIVLLIVISLAEPLNSMIQTYNLSSFGTGGEFIQDQATNLLLLLAGLSTIVNTVVAMPIEKLVEKFQN